MATTPVNITGATTMVGFTIAPPFSTSDVYTFSFPYISQEDFEITVNSETILDPSEYEFTSDYLIQLTSAGVTNLNTLYGDLTDVPMIIRRRTTLDSRLVDFRDASTLTEQDLDLSAIQLFYLIQEIYDTAEIGNVEFNPIDGSIDFNGVILVNVGYPNGETAAATLGSVLDNVITPNYTEGDTYRQYRMVFYLGDLYRANVDIDDAPAVFDSGDWDVVLTAAQLTQIATNADDIVDIKADIVDIELAIVTIQDSLDDLSDTLDQTDLDVLAVASDLEDHEAENETAHTERDTKANLDTWALTATNGAQAYATDTKQAFIVKDGILVGLGSGSGGLDVLHTDDFELANVFATGNNATPDAAGTGTLNGVVSDDTSTEINGLQSLKYVMGAASTNDFFINGADIPLFEKHTNNWLGINFYFQYNGTDDDIRFFVLDQNDVELTVSTGTQRALIKAASTATRFSTAVYIPDGVSGIRYGFQVITGNNTKILLVDDLEISTNPFVYKNLSVDTSWQAYTPTFTGFGTVSGVNFHWRRDGSDVLIRGIFTSGTPTGVEARLSLPTGLTTLSTLPASLSMADFYIRNQAGAAIANKGAPILLEPSKTYFTFSTSVVLSGSAADWQLSAAGSSIVAAGDELTLNTRIPIESWSPTAEHVVTPVVNSINSLTLAGSDSRSITATTESVFWSGSGTGWTTGADGSTPTTGNYYTVQSVNSIINLQGAIDNSGGGWSGTLRLYKNGSSYKLVAENNTERYRTFNFTSKKGEFAVGDKLAFVVSAGITVNNTAVDHYLNINEYMDAKMLSTIPLLEQPQYLTTEHWTGKIWNDGKRIYRKTIAGSYANGATLVSGVAKMTDVGGIFVNTATAHYPVAYNNGSTFSIPSFNPTTNLITHVSNATYTLDIWLEYTKV